MTPGNLSDSGIDSSGPRESGEEFWLVWFPSLLAAVVITALCLVSGVF